MLFVQWICLFEYSSFFSVVSVTNIKSKLDVIAFHSTFMTESIRKMTEPGVTVQTNDACEVLRLCKLYPSRHMTSK